MVAGQKIDRLRKARGAFQNLTKVSNTRGIGTKSKMNRAS